MLVQNSKNWTSMQYFKNRHSLAPNPTINVERYTRDSDTSTDIRGPTCQSRLAISVFSRPAEKNKRQENQKSHFYALQITGERQKTIVKIGYAQTKVREVAFSSCRSDILVDRMKGKG